MRRKANGQEPQGTRRTFLKSTGALAAGLSVAGLSRRGVAAEKPGSGVLGENSVSW